MKLFTRLVVIVCTVWICCDANPVTNDKAPDCNSMHSDEVTWQKHCDHLNRECEMAQDAKQPKCGNCKGKHLPDVNNKERCFAENTCDQTHSSGVGTWKQNCDLLNKKCTPPTTATTNAICADCLNNTLEEDRVYKDKCVAKKSCDGTHAPSKVPWKEFCAESYKICIPSTDVAEAKCEGCIQGYEPQKTDKEKCVVKRSCDDAHPSGGSWKDFCNVKKRVCAVPSAAGNDDWCGACVADHVEDKVDKTKCVAQKSCEGSHPNAGVPWAKYCEQKNRICEKSTDTADAKCGNCKTDHRPSVDDEEHCVPATLDCEGRHSDGVTWQQHCDHLNRKCDKPTSTSQEAKCGDCKDRHVEDPGNKERCFAPDSCDNTHVSGMGTWKEYCDALKRKCIPTGKCTECVDGYELDKVNKETCVAKKSCEGTHPNALVSWNVYCLSNNKRCTPSTDTAEAKCGDCLPGYQEVQNDKETCHPRQGCDGLHSNGVTWNDYCGKMKRICSPGNETTDISCGECIADHVEDENDECILSTEDTTVKPKECPELTAPDDGEIVGGSCKNVQVGGKCQFKCKAKYELDGKKELECQDVKDGQNGKWSDKKPTCSSGAVAMTSIFVTLTLTLTGLLS